MAEASEGPRKTCIIGVGNQKGGVSKTTSTVHMAAALGELGRKVLVIDLDMNQGATRHLGIPSESFLGAFEVLTGLEQPKDVVISPEEDGIELPKNMHLISARRNLEAVEETLRSKNKFIVTQNVLVKPLQTLEGEYDYIFLDTAPNATAPTVAAYMAAHYFILAAMPDPFAVTGLNDALTDIQDAQRNGNPNLRILGVLLAGVDGRKTRLASTLIDYVEKQFSMGDGKSAKFETTISRSTAVPEAQKDGKTLFQTSPSHKIAEQYRAVAREIEARLGRGVAEVTPARQEQTSEALEKAVANG